MKLIDKLLIVVILLWVVLGAATAVDSVCKYVNNTQQKLSQLDNSISAKVKELQSQISINKTEVSNTVDNLKSTVAKDNKQLQKVLNDTQVETANNLEAARKI